MSSPQVMPADAVLGPEALPPLDETPGVSYIMPVLNEEAHLAPAVRTVLAQDYDGDKEIVLALGSSSDDTDAVAQMLAEEDPRVILVRNEAGDTPTGLNLAIANTMYPVIIRVDAHSELTSDYTKQALAVLRDSGAANVGGLMEARGRGAFQRAVARAYMSDLGLGGPAYHSGDEAQESESAYLGVFRREVFDVLGGFDSSLRRGQDWELNLRIRESGGSVRFDPRLRVTYWPRASWKHLQQQFFATGIWRAEIVRRHSNKNGLRYFAPPALVLGVSASALAAGLQASGMTRSWPVPMRALLNAAHVPSLAYLGAIGAAAATAKDAGPAERVWYSLVLPTMHLSWGAGFLRGLVTGADAHVTDKSRDSVGSTGDV